MGNGEIRGKLEECGENGDGREIEKMGNWENRGN